MSNIEKKPEVRKFPISPREVKFAALFGGTLGLALIASAAGLAEILLGQ